MQDCSRQIQICLPRCIVLQVTANDCTLTRNSAVHGGAVHLQDQATANFTSSSFTANNASGSAGAIFAQHKSSLTLSTAVMKSNRAQSGGAVALYDTASAVASGLTCIGNAAAVEGGCVHRESSGVSAAADE
jgi:hypothetical protein